MKPLLLLCLSFGLGGCRGAPSDALTFQESWELFVLGEDGAVLSVAAETANTGLLRGQRRLRLDRLAEGEEPARYRRVLPPTGEAEAARPGLAVGPDKIAFDEARATWTVAVHSDARRRSDGDADAELSLRLREGALQPASASARVTGGQWTAAAPVTEGEVIGWFSAGKQGGLVRGSGLLLHRGGDGLPGSQRLAAFALGRTLSVGFHLEAGAALAWARVDGRELPAQDARLRAGHSGVLWLDLRPAADLVVTLRPRRPAGSLDPGEHLFSVERALLRWTGVQDALPIQRASATVRLEGSPRRVSGLLIGDPSILPPLDAGGRENFNAGPSNAPASPVLED